MMKTTLAIVCFGLFGVLAYFGLTGPSIDNQWKGAPNLMNKMPMPCPPPCAEDTIKAIVKANDDTRLFAKSLPNDVHEALVQYRGGRNVLW